MIASDRMRRPGQSVAAARVEVHRADGDIELTRKEGKEEKKDKYRAAATLSAWTSPAAAGRHAARHAVLQSEGHAAL